MEVSKIATIHSPFKQKLGVPRQPLLCPDIKGKIVFEKEFAREDTLRGLESFQYLWLIYWCHKSDSWRETIKPPRLGGKEKLGFLATRSPHRPNPLGLSIVKLESINDDYSLTVSGLDILDQTPLIDLKPYLSMWDAHPDAGNGWVDRTPQLEPIPVEISEEEKTKLSAEDYVLLEQTLCWDPRPAYTKDPDRDFIHIVGPLEVTWKREKDKIVVLKIKKN